MSCDLAKKCLIKLIPNIIRKQGTQNYVKKTPQGNYHMIQNVGHPIKSWLRLIFSVKGKNKLGAWLKACLTCLTGNNWTRPCNNFNSLSMDN